MNVQEACNILGINVGASKDDARKAFRQLAAKHHPDKGGSEVEFKKINEAYRFVDQNGTTLPTNPFSDMGSFFSSNVNRDIFDDFFRINFNSKGSSFGFRHVHVNNVKQEYAGTISISFAEAVTGTLVSMPVEREAPCVSCNSFKKSQEDDLEACKYCEGKGFYNVLDKEVDQELKCSNCRGTGKVASPKVCEECNGKLRSKQISNVKVKIPPGIFTGARVRVPFNNTQLLFDVQVIPDHELSLQGNDVISIIEINLLEALKGCKKEVKTVKGSKKLVFPPGIRNKDTIRVKGFGVPPHGSHIYIVEVAYPENTEDLIKYLEGNKDEPEEIIGENS